MFGNMDKYTASKDMQLYMDTHTKTTYLHAKFYVNWSKAKSLAFLFPEIFTKTFG